MRETPNTTLASLAAVGSAIAATTCCLPVLPFMLAAGLAGGSTFLWAARPYLLATSILSIAFGFFQAWRAKKCQRRPSAISSVLLWASAAFVVASIFFPLAYSYGGSRAPSGQPALRSVDNLKDEFNAAKNDVRVLLLLSPT